MGPSSSTADWLATMYIFALILVNLLKVPPSEDQDFLMGSGSLSELLCWQSTADLPPTYFPDLLRWFCGCHLPHH